ncbi:hypothetical protein AB4Y35_18270 [Paraburkholderia sp. EG286A]|uniref:hypothetical protein n=1 Tax=Paraburkholderia sp. EG286A TaxID=3237014 RepID=UPI0034D220E5
MQDFDYTLLNVGGLRLAHEFASENQLAGKVPGNLPILTCPLDENLLATVQRQKTGVCFGYGSMGVGDDRLLTFRLQVGGIQIYWLADITDPEVWSAMDLWHRQRYLPHAFETAVGGRGLVGAFGRVGIGSDAPIIGEYRTLQCAEEPDGMWENLTYVAASGFMQLHASTDIPGVRLENVLVNVLVTKRYMPRIQGTVFSEKPTIAVRGNAGTSGVH